MYSNTVSIPIACSDMLLGCLHVGVFTCGDVYMLGCLHVEAYTRENGYMLGCLHVGMFTC